MRPFAHGGGKYLAAVARGSDGEDDGTTRADTVGAHATGGRTAQLSRLQAEGEREKRKEEEEEEVKCQRPERMTSQF